MFFIPNIIELNNKSYSKVSTHNVIKKPNKYKHNLTTIQQCTYFLKKLLKRKKCLNNLNCNTDFNKLMLVQTKISKKVEQFQKKQYHIVKKNIFGGGIVLFQNYFNKKH